MPRRLMIALLAIGAALLFATGALATLLIVGNNEEPASVTVSGSGKGSLGVTVTAAGAQGVRIASLVADGPAARAGLQVGDYIRSVDGQVVRTPEQLRAVVESKAPGTQVSITYERGDREAQATVRLGEAEAGAQIEVAPTPALAPFGRGAPPGLTRGELGIQIQNITPQLVTRYNLARDSGIVITLVMPNSAAARAGLQPGDVILSVNGNAVTTADQVTRFVMATPPGQQVSLGILRGTTEMTIRATLATAFPGLENLPPALRDRIEELARSGTLTPEQLQRLVQGQTNLRVGTVKAIDNTSLTITPLEGGADVTYALDSRTEFRLGGGGASRSDVRIGTTVIVISLDGRTALGVFINQR